MNPEESFVGIDLVEIKGVVTNVHFRKDDFLIATLKTDENTDVKFKGSLYGIDKKDEISIKGNWETHPKYGKQFSVARWERPMPETKEQVIAFLASPLVKGCSAKQAVAVVEKLGEDAIEIINDEGESSLEGIKGIGPKRSNQIVESIRSTFEVQKIISGLLVYGITTDMAMKAYKKFGSNTLAIIEKNPYNLVELNLVGFLKADVIARKMGILPTSGFRIDSCLEFVLKKICFSKGHTFVHEGELFKEVEQALNHNSIGDDIITMEEIEQSIFRLEEDKIVIESGFVYPKFLFNCEDQLARKLSYMKGSRDGEALPFLEKQISTYQRKNGLILAERQREAIRMLFREQVLVLTGGPGTGKTTVVKTMLDIFKSTYPNTKIALAAPTGRASRKLSEVSGMPATTIHKLIGYRTGEIPEYNDKNKLPYGLVIVDEFSMVDVMLAKNLLDAVDQNTKVLFVGDVDQLPSVGPGNVLNDFIQSGIPTVRLNEVFRQAQDSQIITNAHRINKGKSLLIDNDKNDFYFIENENLQSIAELITLSVIRFQNLGHSLSDILVLSPMRMGPVGTIALNEMIRENLNPFAFNKKEWISGERIFREGDKVMQLRNNQEKNVDNGDIGIIVSIGNRLNEKDEVEEVMICDYSGREVVYYKNEMSEIELAYATSIHKSQGGESPIVIIPITMSHRIMLVRNLIYTGMTRAKEKVVFVGTYQAMNEAIKNKNVNKRNSHLTQRIINYRNHNSRFDETKNENAN